VHGYGGETADSPNLGGGIPMSIVMTQDAFPTFPVMHQSNMQERENYDYPGVSP
jgi:hypothetical protein